ncbi:MAG: FAD-binding oxidoreductase [Cyanothece sp. SIO1E1]|nr:FAD-binding oxidoreductase [Cyanothece sp. SIO1E1]
MQTFDWIVIGNGITGAMLSYELTQAGHSVLLLEQSVTPSNATRYSYGGIAYWAGTTELTRQLCQEGIERYRQLSEELNADVQFRELDLLLTISQGRDPEAIAATYANVAIPPQPLSLDEACGLEPLLNRGAIAGALTVRHGHIHPLGTVQAFNQAFQRLGGVLEYAQVTELVRAENRITGIKTPNTDYFASQMAVCAGGSSRALLNATGIAVPLCFSRAELIETAPVEPQLRVMVMPAELKRFELEAKAGDPDMNAFWDQPGHELAPAILDPGLIQFQDGSLRIGQISRALSDRQAQTDADASEIAMRSAIGTLFPALQAVPGRWQTCSVAFTGDRLPLVGPIPGLEGIHLFSGFSNPLAILLPTAVRFARWLNGEHDPLIEQMAPARFSKS